MRPQPKPPKAMARYTALFSWIRKVLKNTARSHLRRLPRALKNTNRTYTTYMPNSSDSPGFIPPHGGYENLLSFQKARIVYDGTVRFCERFLNKRDRTYD